MNNSEILNNNTIAAVSTPFGSGAIALVRVSGKSAFEIINKVFVSSKSIENTPSHSLIYGKIVSGGKTIDNCLLGIYKAPNTFTGENMAEINCHGGIKVTSMVLDAVLSAGARMAERGEFSKRAFVNGRMDLSEAEAVIDLINAKTEGSVLQAAKQMAGGVSAEINKIRDSLAAINAKILAVIDFPDEEIDEMQTEEFKKELIEKKTKIRKLIDSFSKGKIYRSGLAVLIIGKTNAGKSSLLNLLLNEKKAIVTPLAGTTRDVIEDYIDISGIPVKLMDTAGIRKTDDMVENIGVEMSKSLINDADIIINVIDSSRPLDDDDFEIFDLIKDKNVIYVMNKTDLERKADFDKPCIEISCEKGLGAEQLCDEIKKRAGSFSADETLINNVRHKSELEKAEKNIDDAISAIDAGIPADIVSIDIENACMNLGNITGLDVSRDTVTHIFADFCVGK